MTGVIEMNTYSISIDWQESAFVGFDRGYIKIDLPAPMTINRPGRVEILSGAVNGAAPQTTVPLLPWMHAMRQQAMNFVSAIKGEMEPPCYAQEALEDLKVAREYFRLWKKV
jgi:predicted dehydrogenase